MDLFGRIECRCETCNPNPLPTYTRKFMWECEVRHVVGLPSNADRRSYLEGVEKHRGANAAHRLREAVWAIMKEAA